MVKRVGISSAGPVRSRILLNFISKSDWRDKPDKALFQCGVLRVVPRLVNEFSGLPARDSTVDLPFTASIVTCILYLTRTTGVALH